MGWQSQTGVLSNRTLESVQVAAAGCVACIHMCCTCKCTVHVSCNWYLHAGVMQLRCVTALQQH